MHDKLLYPDVYVVMSVEVLDIQRHLLPTYLEKWREQRCRYEKQLNLLHILQAKARVSKTWMMYFLPFTFKYFCSQ